MRKREWIYLAISFFLCLPTLLFGEASNIAKLCIDYWWLYGGLLIGFGIVLCTGWPKAKKKQ